TANPVRSRNGASSGLLVRPRQSGALPGVDSFIRGSCPREVGARTPGFERPGQARRTRAQQAPVSQNCLPLRSLRQACRQGQSDDRTLLSEGLEMADTEEGEMEKEKVRTRPGERLTLARASDGP